jgi:Uma2 family endonuclease
MRMTIQLAAHAEQTPFNLKRWSEILEDEFYQKYKGSIETNRHGEVILMPSADVKHSKAQAAIALLLQTCLKDGEVLLACPISTADGIKACDVAWTKDASNCREVCARAPEICIEVRSTETCDEEISERVELYLDAGAKEVWICEPSLAMKFYDAPKAPARAASKLCSLFPTEIQVR